MLSTPVQCQKVAERIQLMWSKPHQRFKSHSAMWPAHEYIQSNQVSSQTSMTHSVYLKWNRPMYTAGLHLKMYQIQTKHCHSSALQCSSTCLNLLRWWVSAPILVCALSRPQHNAHTFHTEHTCIRTPPQVLSMRKDLDSGHTKR